MLTDFRLFLALPIASALRPLAAAPQLAAAPPSRVAPGISGGACGLGGGHGLEARRAAAGRQQGRGWTGRGSASRATAWRDRRAQGPLRSAAADGKAAQRRAAAALQPPPGLPPAGAAQTRRGRGAIRDRPTTRGTVSRAAASPAQTPSRPPPRRPSRSTPPGQYRCRRRAPRQRSPHARPAAAGPQRRAARGDAR